MLEGFAAADAGSRVKAWRNMLRRRARSSLSCRAASFFFADQTVCRPRKDRPSAGGGEARAEGKWRARPDQSKTQTNASVHAFLPAPKLFRQPSRQMRQPQAGAKSRRGPNGLSQKFMAWTMHSLRTRPALFRFLFLAARLNLSP